MTEKLDLKDKKIIFALSQDARLSHSQLAKQLGLSKNAVTYRIKRLQREHIIEKFIAVINIGALKLDTFCLLLKFNEDIYGNPDILSYIENHSFINWAVVLSGDWDFFVEFVYKDLRDTVHIVTDITQRFGKRLNTYNMYFSYDIIKVEHLLRDFSKEFTKAYLPRKKRTAERYDVDATDKQLLYLLATDSALSYVAITKKLSLSLDVVRYRMKRLAERAILAYTTPHISIRTLGYTAYLCTVHLENITQEQIITLKSFIQQHDNITYAFFDQISLRMVFVIAFRTPVEIDVFSHDLRKNYIGSIKEQTYTIIRQELVYNLFPKGLL
ncbi:MAG TPA: winged helix-turn-helix transcriptional regulator [Candidatus Nanoarchaeia archaeon]|nr:winged helix-turn-helix transcriptional regulator [Candidatus Nanoarchaeia archaeon]